jgi:hypothetical protein
MANISVVEDTLVNLISGILYPNGTSQPSIVPSVGNIRVYAGWPVPPSFEADMNAGNAHITIFPQNTGRNTTRFPQNWLPQTFTDPTITLTLIGNQITIGGIVSIPQSCMIVVNGIGYAYGILETDTLDTIAAALALIVPNSSASGNVLTISSAISITPRVTSYGTSAKEIKRQECIFNVITWAFSRDTRTNVSDPVEIGLGALSRFLLPTDNFYCPIFYMGLKDHEELQKSIPIYRRDLMFRIEYPTIISEQFTNIEDVILDISNVNQIT